MTKSKSLLGFSARGAGTTICIGVALLVIATAAQMELPRNALWEIVHNICVAGQAQHGGPRPCLQVDLMAGNEKGFAILRDPRKTAQFLFVPTAKISGIESPMLLAPNGTNYFAEAWEARTYIGQALHKTIPRDGIGMAINSILSRSQDQLHIHIACARSNVLNTLHRSETQIGSRWARFDVPLPRRHYMAMWVPGENLGAVSPFQLLAGVPGAAGNMGNYTLAVVALSRSDGAKGFVLLADYVDKQHDNSAGAEELLDPLCRIESAQK